MLDLDGSESRGEDMNHKTEMTAIELYAAAVVCAVAMVAFIVWMIEAKFA